MKTFYLTIAKTIVLCAILFLSNNSHAQSGLCTNPTPFEVADLTGYSDGDVWISSSISRNGNCCSVSDNCLEFEVHVDDRVDMIDFDIVEGAVPTGAMFYQIDCGPPVAVGEPICITGTGPHTLTFCKPGNNRNRYSIRPIFLVHFPPDVTTKEGCQIELGVSGLDLPTISWNSISPGAPGSYNSFLDCNTGCDTVNVSPFGTFPEFVEYEVCGNPPPGGCTSGNTYCDTVRVYFDEQIEDSVYPNPAYYCKYDGSIDLTASSVGGSGQLTYIWYSGHDSSGSIIGSNQILNTVAGQYSVEIRDSLYPLCPSSVVNVDVYELDLTANIINQVDATCNGVNNGSFEISASLGLEPYEYSIDGINFQSSPIFNNVSAGTYNITVRDAVGCQYNLSTTLTEPPAISLIGGLSDYNGNQISCFGDNSGAISLNVSGGTPTLTYLWSTSNGSGLVPTNEDQSGLTAGTYNITVTDIYGCTLDTSFTLTQPTPLLQNILINTDYNGSDVTCLGASDGGINYTPSGGTLPYNYTWTSIDGSGFNSSSQNQGGITSGTYNVTLIDANGCSIDTSITVVDPAPFNQNIIITSNHNGEDISCFGAADGSIDYTVTGGTGTLSTAWTSTNGSGFNISSEDQTGITAGTYNVVTTDANGCTTDTSITLTQPDLLTQDVLPTTNYNGFNISCNGLSDGGINYIPLGGTLPYNFLWTTTDGFGHNSSSEDQVGVSAGTYNVTITDINGCSIDTSITLSEPSALTQDINISTDYNGSHVSCFGASDGGINYTPFGGTSPYNYSWSSADGSGFTTSSQNQGGVTSGTYLVSLVDANGCTIDTSITLIDPTPLAQDIAITSDYSGRHVSCFGASDGAIDFSISGGTTPYIYNWSSVDGNNFSTNTQDQSGIEAGTYNVTITDANGCSLDTSITLINPPFMRIDQNLSITTDYNGFNVSCFGASDGGLDYTYNGGTAPYTFLWTSVDGANFNPSSEDQTGITAGTYNVDITDVNGCSVDTTVTLTEPTPLIQNINISSNYNGQDVSCFGASDGSIEYTLSGGVSTYTFNWTSVDGSGFNTSTEDQSGISAGTYNVTATDANGCSIDTSLSVVNPLPLTQDISVTTDYNGTSVSCFGASDGAINFIPTGGTAPYTYNWTSTDGSGFNTSSEDQSGISAGTYNVTVTDANGCFIDTSITLTQPNPLNQSQDITITSDYNGEDISCYGASDASINYTTGGGIAPYTFNWTTTDGGGLTPSTEDQSAVSAGTYTITITDANGCSIDTSITVSEPTALNQNITIATNYNGEDVSCVGSSDGGIDYTSSGGVSPYTYNWTSIDGSGFNPLSQNQNGITAGTYNVTVTDANGCLIDTTIVLVDPTPLTQDITIASNYYGENVSCFGASDGAINYIPTGGTGAYTYVWSSLDGLGINLSSEDQNGVTAGTYDVIITDANGCTIDTSIILTEPTPITITSTMNESTCGTNNGSLSVVPSGGTPTYYYSWSNGANTANNTDLFSGSYTVTITDNNGCTFDSTLAVNDFASPTISIDSIVNILCNSDATGEISTTISGGTAPFSIAWNSGENTEDISNKIAGTYTMTVTDGNGCIAIADTTLTEPTPLIQDINISSNYNGQNVSCFGASDGAINYTINGGITNYTYSWTSADGSGFNSSTEDQSGITSGTYNVSVIDAHGCVIDTTITLTQPTPLSQNITITSDYNGQNISCHGASDGAIDYTTLGGITPYSFDWSSINGTGFNNSSEDQSGITAGTYNVTVTDLNGCSIDTNITLTDPTPLNQNQNIEISSNYNGEDVSCYGASDGSINYTTGGGIAPYTFNWSTTDGSGLIQTSEDQNAVSAGTYTINVTDANGCFLDTSITLINPLILSNNINISTDYNGEDVSCFGASDGAINIDVLGGVTPYSYNWSNGEITEDISNLIAGDYVVTITDLNGCIIQDSIIVTEPTIVTSTFSLSNFNGFSLRCFEDQSGSIESFPTGGVAPYSYQWSTGETGKLITGKDAIQYNVIVRDINGCSFEDSVTLTQPTEISLDLTLDTTVCVGQSLDVEAIPSGGLGNFHYMWSTGFPNAPGPHSLTPNNNINICVTVTDMNGCKKDTCYLLIPSPPINVDELLTSNTMCNLDSTLMNVTPTGGTGLFNFEWYDATNTLVHSNTSSNSSLMSYDSLDNTYRVDIFDANCDVQTSKTFDITVYPEPRVSLTQYSPIGCAPVVYEFQINKAPGTRIDYDFNCNGILNGSTTNSSFSYEFLTSGSYTLCYTATTDQGCTNNYTYSNPVEVIEQPLADFTVSSILLEGVENTVTFTNSSSYSDIYTWDVSNHIASGFDGEEIDDASGHYDGTFNQFTYTFDSIGIYDIWLYSSNQYGCIDSSTITITYRPMPAIYVPNVFTPNGDDINDFFCAEGVALERDDFVMLIFDRWGHKVFESDHMDQKWDGKVDGVIGKNDVYFYRVWYKDIFGARGKLEGSVTIIR